MSACVKGAGFSTASLDIDYHEAPPLKQNFMDLLTPAGMALLRYSLKCFFSCRMCNIWGRMLTVEAPNNDWIQDCMLSIICKEVHEVPSKIQKDQYFFFFTSPNTILFELVVGLRLAMATILNARPGSFVCLIALICSSFTVVNRYTSQRHITHPLGDESKQYVRDANVMASRLFVCIDVSSNFPQNHEQLWFCSLPKYITWIYPPPSNSHHQDYSFLVGNPYKPSFVTISGWGVDRN